MLRNLQTIPHKNADAMFKAASEVTRGRLVQKNHVTKTAILPTSQEGLYFINKDNYPIGIMSVEGELSDYDPRLEKIQAGESVVLETPLHGERYGVSEYVPDGLVEGDHLEVEIAGANQGKLKKSTDVTKFKYCGTFNDNGHTLAVIEVL